MAKGFKIYVPGEEMNHEKYTYLALREDAGSIDLVTVEDVDGDTILPGFFIISINELGLFRYGGLAAALVRTGKNGKILINERIVLEEVL